MSTVETRHIRRDNAHHHFLGNGIAGGVNGIAGGVDGLDDMMGFGLAGDFHVMAEGVGVGAEVRGAVARRQQRDHLAVNVDNRTVAVVAHMADNAVPIVGRVNLGRRLDQEFRKAHIALLRGLDLALEFLELGRQIIDLAVIGGAGGEQRRQDHDNAGHDNAGQDSAAASSDFPSPVKAK